MNVIIAKKNKVDVEQTQNFPLIKNTDNEA